MNSTITPILDAKLLETLSELRARLTRGGLSPEAVQKAIEAFKAGDLHALSFATTEGCLVVPIPEDLLVRVFPQLQDQTAAEGPQEPGNPWKAFLATKPILEYEINRHRGDRRSLTIRWPDTKAEEGPDPEQVETSGAEEGPDPEQNDPFA